MCVLLQVYAAEAGPEHAEQPPMETDEEVIQKVSPLQKHEHVV